MRQHLVKRYIIIHHKPSRFNPCSTKRKGQIIVLVIHVMHKLLSPFSVLISWKSGKANTKCTTKHTVLIQDGLCVYTRLLNTH